MTGDEGKDWGGLLLHDWLLDVLPDSQETVTLGARREDARDLLQRYSFSRNKLCIFDHHTIQRNRPREEILMDPQHTRIPPFRQPSSLASPSPASAATIHMVAIRTALTAYWVPFWGRSLTSSRFGKESPSLPTQGFQSEHYETVLLTSSPL